MVQCAQRASNIVADQRTCMVIFGDEDPMEKTHRVFCFMFKLTFQVKRKDWLKYPEKRWNAGLVKAGEGFKRSLSRNGYPSPPAGSKYKRTYQLADQANFVIVSFGKRMDFGSTSYLPYVLYGTNRWVGWPRKKQQIENAMNRGLKEGIRDYKE